MAIVADLSGNNGTGTVDTAVDVSNVQLTTLNTSILTGNAKLDTLITSNAAIETAVEGTLSVDQIP